MATSSNPVEYTVTIKFSDVEGYFRALLPTMAAEYKACNSHSDLDHAAKWFALSLQKHLVGHNRHIELEDPPQPPEFTAAKLIFDIKDWV